MSLARPRPELFPALLFPLACLLALLGFATTARAAFGLSSSTDFYTVDTGGGLVFKIRRTDNGSSTQSAGDIASLVYNGVEYQNTSRGTQINSGFDYLYTGISAVSVGAATVGSDFIRITVVAGDLTHYYVARRGYPHIYMATYFTSEPDTLGMCRFIVRIPQARLPNGPTPSDIRDTVSTVESGDIFALANGETRSKHYSNMRLKDWSYIGATGSNVGVWIFRSNHEGDSGGPFYRSLLNQCGSDQELTYILNYGQAQTEAFRTSVLNGPYTLVFNDGSPPVAPDTSWAGSLGFVGYVGPEGRGTVRGAGILNRDTDHAYTVGFANSQAQYWTDADPATGAFAKDGILPGTYTLSVYKNELAVHTAAVTVSAGGVVDLPAITLAGDPQAVVPLWRIGAWDGTPCELLNGDKVTVMHPSDPRMSPWAPGAYAIGTASPATGFPAYHWAGVNSGQTITFRLTAGQLTAGTLRVGLTCAYSNARPRVTVNNWTSAIPAISAQPGTRTLTTGTYRGNNVTYTFAIPASALVTGTNTLAISPVSGSGLTGFLSAGYSVDCVDYYQGSATTRAVPAAPATLTATAGDGRVNLAWNALLGASGYRIRRAVGDGDFATLAESHSTSAYLDTDVLNGTRYRYQVQAINSSGAGLPSPEAAATPATAFASWLFQYWGVYETDGDAAHDADPDHDGRPNLLEYATGASPLSPDAEPPATLSSDGTRLSLTFRRIADPALTYQVEAADELAGPWLGIWDSTGEDNQAGLVTVPDQADLTDHPRRFLRLRVSR